MEKGEVINNRYKVLYRIGRGGTSDVYKVYDMHVGRNLAMKIVRCDEPAFYHLAKGEIDTLKSIRYPLFPTIHDAFAKGRSMFILSEYIEGVRLDDLISQNNISRDEALRIIGRIADAITYLHEQKPPILYLDLKPENIIMTNSGLPMLVDFGIATQITRKKICMGTYGYSPPEQYENGGRKIDERSDIFALAITYMAIRGGEPPGRELEKNREYIRKSKRFSKTERAFLLRATSYDKSDRFACMRDVKHEIQHIRDYPKKTVKKLIVSLLIISLSLIGGFTYRNSGYRKKEKEAAFDMARDASQYMIEGEYTKEGMGIIKTFVQSGCLSRETEQNFIYEVAKNSLYFQRDYQTAAVYYSKLDKQQYPSAGEYERLCRMISGFGDSDEDSLKLIGMYYGDVLEMAPSVAKYENVITASELFEEYEPNRIEGIKKSLTVLEGGISEIDKEGESFKEGEKAEIYGVRKKMIELQEKKNMRAKELCSKDAGGNR